MGILNDLKKIIFGATAVGKTVTEKTTDFVMESGSEIIDKTKEVAEKTGDIIEDKTSGLKDSILENSADLIERTKEKISDVKDEIAESPVVQKAADITEEVGEKVMSTGSDILEKASDISEKVGEKVIEKGGDLLEKSKTVSESVGEKVLEVKDDIFEKAKQASERISEKLDETMDKAEAWAEAEKAKPKRDFAEEDLDASGSLLEGTDDFFSKADKFASGQYDAFSEGKITIHETGKSEDQILSQEPVAGFEDLDGDGNEIIDDAIIDEEG
ncbi:MAG: apolipoprotein A1/A4/E family protein [Bacteroidia bacterium]|nr:apolipoprotein A1/A4/E family protein [Bacteroidia bacterium]